MEYDYGGDSQKDREDEQFFFGTLVGFTLGIFMALAFILLR